jgi:hypothetical protein
MACPTGQPVGTSGETIVSLSLLRRSRTGSKLGGKKAQVRMDTDFLDWALADFSGYVAADELAAPGKFEAERFASMAQEWLLNLLTWSVVLPRTLRILLAL